MRRLLQSTKNLIFTTHGKYCIRNLDVSVPVVVVNGVVVGGFVVGSTDRKNGRVSHENSAITDWTVHDPNSKA